ncbi:MAG: serine hydrolase [Candidatus Binatia bacterium]|nr:serine hydrolase [Candidatus Binatia bacterium]
MQPKSAHLLVCLVATLAALPFVTRPASADDLSGGEIFLEADAAPLWDAIDPVFQRQLEQRLDTLGFTPAIRNKNLGVAVVDITDPEAPRVAAVNGDVMIYAASLPKIAILLGAFERIEAGELQLTAENERLLHLMIQRSSNKAATVMMDRVGKEYIAETLRSDEYRLYDVRHNGGLWAGKDYGKAGLWRRDPLHNLSHGATAMQVARFYYMMETGELVDEEASAKMKELMADSAIKHKFVKALDRIDPDAEIYRKSGSWQQWHADSAIVERDGRRYIAVGLCEDQQGGRWLERIFHVMDALVMESPSTEVARLEE